MSDYKMITTNEVFKNGWYSLYTESFYYPSTYEISDHAHEFMEIGITLKGTASHISGSSSRILCPGSVYLIAPMQAHSLQASSEWHVQNVYLLPKALPGNFPPDLKQFLTLAGSPLMENKMFCQLTEQDLKALCSLLDAYSGYSHKASQSSDSFQYHCMLGLLYIICDTFKSANPSISFQPDDRVLTIVRLIERHLSLPSSELTSLISSRLSLHPQSLNRLIKKDLGISLNQFILESKLENSCGMLLEGIPVTDVAITMGFYDHSHYNKYFLKYFGLTPSEYKKKYRLSTDPIHP